MGPALCQAALERCEESTTSKELTVYCGLWRSENDRRDYWVIVGLT